MVLDKLFPQCGNDLKGGIRSDWHGQTETGRLLAPRPAFLDSSLRWNDERDSGFYRAAAGVLGDLFLPAAGRQE